MILAAVAETLGVSVAFGSSDLRSDWNGGVVRFRYLTFRGGRRRRHDLWCDDELSKEKSVPP